MFGDRGKEEEKEKSFVWNHIVAAMLLFYCSFCAELMVASVLRSGQHYLGQAFIYLFIL